MANRTVVLMVTVTDVETHAVLRAFEIATRQKACAVPIDGRVYRDLGKLNGAQIFLALSEMGAGGLGASLQTVQKGIEALKPSAVIMVGIAFGMNDYKQRLGDILISRQLMLYEPQRVGTAEIVPRGDRAHASPRLLDYLRSANVDWQGATVRFGLLLTGEKLLDNIDYREQLQRLETEAIGGEMEGAGLYVACQDAKVDWVLVKSICDWADGNKAQDKDTRQRQAAENSAAFVAHALQHSPIFHNRRRPKISILKYISVGVTGVAFGAIVIAISADWAWRKRREPAVCQSLQQDEIGCFRDNKASCYRLFECQNWRCMSGKGSACTAKCLLYETGKGTEESPSNAFNCYDQDCKNGNNDSCFYAASMLVEGVQGVRDEASARDRYSELCEKGEPRACNNLGNLYYEGKGGFRDENKARAYFQRACDENYFIGCSNLSMARAFDETQINKNLALLELERNCEQNLAGACNSVGVVKSKNIGEQSKIDALKYFDKSCHLNFAIGCLNSAKILTTLHKQTKDLVIYTNKACELGSSRGCQKSCELGESDACSRLNNLHSTQDKNMQSRNQDMAQDNVATQLNSVISKQGKSPIEEAPFVARQDEFTISGDSGSRCVSGKWQRQSFNGHGQLIRDYPVVAADVLILTSVDPNDKKIKISEETSIIQMAYRSINFHTSNGLECLFSVIKKTRPKILHFSGHGSASSPLWVDANNDYRYVGHEMWSKMAALLAKYGVQCILLNTCYSDEIGYSLAGIVDRVIAISGEITNRAAIQLSAGFYASLKKGNCFRDAFKFAREQSIRAQPNIGMHLFAKRECEQHFISSK